MDLQFLATRTILWHIHERWSTIQKHHLEDLSAFFWDYLIQRPVGPSLIRNKLIQALSVFLINIYPDTVLLSRFSTLDASTLICIYTELPAELERIGDLSISQNAFRQHLGEMSHHLLSIIASNLAHKENVLESLKCATNWCIFKSFTKQAITLVIPHAIAIMNDQDYAEAAHELLLTWLESGVPDHLLLPLLSTMAQHPFRLHDDGTFERATSILFLYGELVANHLINPHNVQLRFLEQLAEMTEMLDESSTDEAIESMSTFWATFADMVVQGPNDAASSIILSVTKIVMGKVFQVSPSARLHLGQFLIAAYSTLGDSLLLFLKNALHDGHLKKSAYWSLAQLAESVSPENLLLPNLLAMTLDTPIGIKSQLWLWQQYAEAIKRDVLLVERAANHVFDVIMSKPPPILDSALITLSRICCPTLYPTILRNINLLTMLQNSNKTVFWRIVCEAVNYSKKSTTLDELIQFLRPECNPPTMFGTVALTALVRIAPLQSLLSLLEPHQICRFDLCDPQWVKPLGSLWVSVVESYCPQQSELVMELLRPSMVFILSSLNSDLIAIPEAMIPLCPGVADMLSTSVSFAIRSQELCYLEEFSVALLPLYNKTFPRLDHCDDTVLGLLQKLLQKISSSSNSDPFLRLAGRTLALALAHPNMDPSLQPLIFDSLLYSTQHTILPSQLDIVAFVLLELLKSDPVSRGRALKALAKNVAQEELVRKMVACRMPRLFARLLSQLISQ